MRGVSTELPSVTLVIDPEMAGVDDDRERSPLHEQRDMFEVDSNNRDMFKTRVRKSGSSGILAAKGPLVRFVYFASDNTAAVTLIL